MKQKTETRKINGTKTWFSGIIQKKINKSLARPNKKKREKTQQKSEMRKATLYNWYHRTIRIKQTPINDYTPINCTNYKKWVLFPEPHNLIWLNHEEISLKQPINSKVIESVIKKTSQREAQLQMPSTEKPTKDLKNLHQSLSNSSKKLKREHFQTHPMRPE